MKTAFYINDAPLKELLEISGIGPALVQRIISSRKFSNRDEVLAVKGIGPTSLSAIEKENEIEFQYELMAMALSISDFLEAPMKIRNDSSGSGFWHAPRGARLHKGVDVLSTSGQKVFAPISGKISKYGYTKSRNNVLRYIEITGENADSDFLVRLHYCSIKNQSLVDTNVVRNQHIGYCQDVSGEYNDPNMEDHIHFEFRSNGIVSDPTPYLNLV